ncbi:MAG: hypothetical protein ACRBN8_20605 [Nannocystales bacterium]
MLRRSSLVALLSAAGCFAEPSTESSTASGGSSSQGTTTAIETEPTETTPGSSSTGTDADSDDPSSSGSTGGDCVDGRVGCPCDEGQCENDAMCIEGVCELVIPDGCGDDTKAGAEECDDGNNEPGDGCSPICRFERECFFAHLGGPGKTSVVRSYSVLPDGAVENLGEIDVPGHNPPLTGIGSELSNATVACLDQVYVASTAGTITGLRPSQGGVSISNQTPVPGVRELACDAERELLFATRVIENGFAIDTFDIEPAALTLNASGQYTNKIIPEIRAARLTLDRPSQRLFVNFVASGTAPVAPFYVQGTYGPGEVLLDPPEVLSVVRDDLSAVLHVAPTSQLVGVGAGTTDGRAVYRIPVDADGPGPLVVQTDPPWEDRRNLWPVRLPDAEVGFAMGGSQGVVIVGYGADDVLEVRGVPLAPTLTGTFARTAFNDSMLIVASPTGFETYDLTQPGAEWTMLNVHPQSLADTFTSGAVVPCP